MVNEKFKRMQLATAQARIGELERRAVSDTNRAQKERERKKRQKAARRKAAGEEEHARRERQQAAATNPAQLDEAQQLARAARLHDQRSPAAKAVVGPMVGRRTASTGDAEGQPASGLAPTTPSAFSPTVTIGVIGAARAGGDATTRAAATMAPTSMEVVQHDEGCRMVDSSEQPAIEPAPSPPVYVWGTASSAAASASAPAAAKSAMKFKRHAAREPKGAADDAPPILYTSRPGGTPFGLAGVPGEQWAGGK